MRGALASLPREQEKRAELITASRPGGSAMLASLVILSITLLGVSKTARASAARVSLNRSSAEAVAGSANQARVEKLRQALDEESQRALYRWHDAEHSSPPTWLDKLLGKIGHAIQRAWNAFGDWLRKLWPRGLTSSKDKGGGWHLKDVGLWLALLLVLTLGVGVVLFWLRRRREAAQISVPVATAPLPDLSNPAVASERSESEWFALAERLEGEGQLRLALRAAYLALLAGLAQREWLTIRRDRTNREYLDEFIRRWRRRPQAAVDVRLEIPEKFRSSLRQFDRVWYGSYGLTQAAVAAYRQGQRELLNHV